MIPIYVVHYNKLQNRREYLEKHIKAHFITRYGREDLKKEHLDSYIPDPNIWLEKCGNMYTETPPFTKLNSGIISCTIGHREILKYISQNDETAIILEDDAILYWRIENANLALDKLIQTAPRNWDVLFLGGAFPHTIAPTKAIVTPWIAKGAPASNTVCAYVVNKESAGKIAKELETFTLPIDFELNHIMKKHDMNVWHISPYFFIEGTSQGIYKSSQDRS